MAKTVSATWTSEVLEQVGREAAQWAWAEGMTVLKPNGSVIPIPLVAQPEVMAREALDRVAAEARAILSGAVKLARALLASGDTRDREALLGPFQGLEAEALGKLFSEAPCPGVLARVDFLQPREPAGALPRALELNATIPAMFAYGDLAAGGWLRAAARARGMSPRRQRALAAACGSRMEGLREALVAFYRWRGGTRSRPSIALVARPGDAQIAELQRLARHFRQMGHEAVNLTPMECDPDRFDILYRHVWAHRTPPEAPFARALREPARYVLANPVNGLLEAKALFARLSECAEDRALAVRAGLDAAERAAAARLPWTRRMESGLAAQVLAGRERYVLKRSWDYGGKSVHLGAELTDEAWKVAVEGALADQQGGGFVVQERIFARRRPSTLVAPEMVTQAELYHDLSAYCGLGEVAPHGAVIRAAASPVVNILGGGGLAPLIPQDVYQQLQ